MHRWFEVLLTYVVFMGVKKCHGIKIEVQTCYFKVIIMLTRGSIFKKAIYMDIS